MGSAVRIFRGPFVGDELFSTESGSSRRSRFHFRDSCGPNFIKFSAARFPELKSFVKDALLVESEIQTCAEAFHTYRLAIESLVRFCKCDLCKGTWSDSDCDMTTFCPAELAVTIIKAVRILSGIVTELSPMRAGLEELNEYTGRARRRGRAEDRQLQDPKRLIEWEGDSMISMECFLESAEKIFYGDKDRLSNGPRSPLAATAYEGICFFFGILQEPTALFEKAAKIHVIPGTIEYNGRQFTNIQDSPTLNAIKDNDGKRDSEIFHSLCRDVKECIDSSVQMLAQEDLDSTGSPKLLCR